MHVSEGHLTQQYLCDYLAVLHTDADILEQLVFQNMFLHRMSADGGFHARVLASILGHPEDCDLLLTLLSDYCQAEPQTLTLKDWLARAYASAAADGDEPRKTSCAALLRSHISQTNRTAEILLAESTGVPESVWRMKSRRIVVDEIRNPGMFFGVGTRPVRGAFPFTRAAAALAGASALSDEQIYDAVLCVAGAWFSTLTRDEMIVWLNMPRTSPEEWNKITRPLLDISEPSPAMSTADWLYASGNFDAALELYANITLAYAGTPAEKPAFEMMGEILRDFGDYDNSVEAYKHAFLLSRPLGQYAVADGLKNLCSAGDYLGEDMHEYYARIAKIASELPAEERLHLQFSLAALARRRHAYPEEYQYLEDIISGEDVSETMFAAAMSRITEINGMLDWSGKPDAAGLAEADDAREAAGFAERGDAAYFGFDPVCALYWYNRAVCLAPQTAEGLKEKMFSAAIAAGMTAEAAKYALESPAFEAAVTACCPDEFMQTVHSLNAAVDAALAAGTPVADALSPAFIRMKPEKRREAERMITADRTTRGDEKSVVLLAVGSVYLDLGMTDEARSVLRAALRANPGVEIRSRIFSELAWLETECGLYREAVETCRSALKQNEMFPAAWGALAKALVCLGEYSEALSAAERAVVLNPAESSYQHMKEALTIISAAPSDAKADVFFALPGHANQAYAAALYAEKNGGDVCGAWSAETAADVVRFR
ncbi:MAG: tetratricopeptide repeat protein [Methanocorpusculum sp.]|nr:tetratricopeptide repeat protein [Methanocorpusculum sp.]